MPELKPQDRLQPSLLYRLTETELHSVASGPIAERRVLSNERYRQLVLRDLTWLLNTGNLETDIDLGPYPRVRKSVLNYGIRDLSGVTASSVDPAFLERAIRQSIVTFEPRIDNDTLRVSVTQGADDSDSHRIVVEIDGWLWAQPDSLRLYLKTEMDVESGTVSVTQG